MNENFIDLYKICFCEKKRNFHKRLKNFIFVIDYDIQLNLNDFIRT